MLFTMIRAALWVMLAPLLTGIAAARANCDSVDADRLRSHPEFLFSEERQSGASLWLEYRTGLSISSHELNLYAEHRSEKLCHGDYRYLSYLAYPNDESEQKTARFRNIEIVAECMTRGER